MKHIQCDSDVIVNHYVDGNLGFGGPCTLQAKYVVEFHADVMDDDERFMMLCDTHLRWWRHIFGDGDGSEIVCIEKIDKLLKEIK